jgi:hypothetical protein
MFRLADIVNGAGRQRAATLVFTSFRQPQRAQP